MLALVASHVANLVHHGRRGAIVGTARRTSLMSRVSATCQLIGAIGVRTINKLQHPKVRGLWSRIRTSVRCGYRRTLQRTESVSIYFSHEERLLSEIDVIGSYLRICLNQRQIVLLYTDRRLCTTT